MSSPELLIDTVGDYGLAVADGMAVQSEDNKRTPVRLTASNLQALLTTAGIRATDDSSKYRVTLEDTNYSEYSYIID